MEAGARVEVAPYKRNPMDFVLWKPSPPELPGWDSPWGRGRPGWHIECSAMSAALLGETFDIHGGGIDLVFPHHENEIAQSRCAFHTPVMANYWMHNGFLQVEGEKMAKSAGNFVTIHELLRTRQFGGSEWPGSTLRFAMLFSHYRQPINWTAERLSEARSECLSFLLATIGIEPRDEVPADFVAALCDDLNTSEAITVLRSLAKESIRDGKKKAQLAAALNFLGLALQKDDYVKFPVFAMAGANSEELAKRRIEQLIAERSAARAAKNWKESDRIRDQLAAMGVVLKDSKDGTTWEIAR
jgi:cysteinyl-tRNA synthetase